LAGGARAVGPGGEPSARMALPELMAGVVAGGSRAPGLVSRLATDTGGWS